jgi:hypothetical protein
MVGKRAVREEVIIEFIAARLPTLQILGEVGENLLVRPVLARKTSVILHSQE